MEFRNASKWQAELLFRNFFPSTDEDDEVIEGELEGVELPTPPSPSTESASGSSTFSSLFAALSSPSASSVASWTGSSTPATPTSSSMSSPRAPKADPIDALKNQAYLPPAVEDDIAAFKHTAPPLDGVTLSKLAKEFADSIPDEEFSVAALQGCKSSRLSPSPSSLLTRENTDLLKSKSSPEKAASAAAAWVVAEREMRERLKKERELKEKQAVSIDGLSRHPPRLPYMVFIVRFVSSAKSVVKSSSSRLRRRRKQRKRPPNWRSRRLSRANLQTLLYFHLSFPTWRTRGTRYKTTIATRTLVPVQARRARVPLPKSRRRGFRSTVRTDSTMKKFWLLLPTRRHPLLLLQTSTLPAP